MKHTYCLSVSRHLVIISDLSELNFSMLADGTVPVGVQTMTILMMIKLHFQQNRSFEA